LPISKAKEEGVSRAGSQEHPLQPGRSGKNFPTKKHERKFRRRSPRKSNRKKFTTGALTLLGGGVKRADFRVIRGGGGRVDCRGEGRNFVRKEKLKSPLPVSVMQSQKGAPLCPGITKERGPASPGEKGERPEVPSRPKRGRGKGGDRN